MVVPFPGVDSALMSRSERFTKPNTMLAETGALARRLGGVEGSKMWSITSAGIPQPVSLILSTIVSRMVVRQIFTRLCGTSSC